MNIKKEMEIKWSEIITTKNKRESLFSDFDKNKVEIVELHFEIEIMNLQYLLLKREQLTELKRSTSSNLNLEKIEQIVEVTISKLQERLIKNGLQERIKPILQSGHN